MSNVLQVILLSLLCPITIFILIFRISSPKANWAAKNVHFMDLYGDAYMNQPSSVISTPS
jgi:hypothetical protein